MPLIRKVVILAAAIMLLPLDERQQAELSATATQTAVQTATYCERNPSTCEAGRELWATFLRKAEYGLELGAGLVREHVVRAMLDSRTDVSKPAPKPQQVKASAQPTAPQPKTTTRVANTN